MVFRTKASIYLSLLIIILLLQVSCTPPRSFIQSGKVTPHRQFKAGIDLAANVPTHVVKSVYKNTQAIVGPLINKDTIILNDQVIKLNETALAY